MSSLKQGIFPRRKKNDTYLKIVCYIVDVVIILLVALISVSVASNFFYKFNKQSPFVTLFAFVVWQFIISTIAFGISFAFTPPPPLNGINLGTIGWIGFSSLLLFASITTWVMGIKSVPVSIATPFAQSTMIFLLGSSWLIFNDAVTWLEITLVVVIFLSCVVMGYFQYKSEVCEVKAKDLLVGLAWLFAWVIMATASSVIKRHIGEQGIQPITFIFMRSGVSIFLAIATLVILGLSLRKTIKQTFTNKHLVGIGLTDGLVGFFSFPLMLLMNLGVLDAITVLGTVLTIFCGVVFLKERIRWYKYPLILIIIAASVALALLSG